MCTETTFGAACFGGNLRIVKFIIENGMHCFQHGLRAASQAGNLKIVKLMISKGGHHYSDTVYRHGLDDACTGGELENCQVSDC